MRKSNDEATIPKSIRHKRILDIAAEKPDAPLEEIAEEIPSTTPDLVEHVLEEYGDPASDDSTAGSGDHEVVETDDNAGENSENGPDGEAGTPLESAATEATEQGEPNMIDETGAPRLEELSEKQRRTLRAIRENPEATQEELAGQLGVSAPTISNRVNSIEGFEWRRRQAFVAAVFNEPKPATEPQSAPDQSATDGGVKSEFDTLAERVTRLEHQLEAWSPVEPTRAVFDDPELLHKVIHACMDSTKISEDEELQILKNLLSPGATVTSDE